MKRLLSVLLVLTSLAAASAGQLPNDQIASDAKWLLHVDFAQFRSTKLGGYLINDVLQKELAAPLAKLKKEIKVDFEPDQLLSKLGSLTIYGTEYKRPDRNAVALVRVEPDIQQILVGALAGMALAGSNAPVQVEQTQKGDVSFYTIANVGSIAILPGKLIAVGKTRAVVEKAIAVCTGKAANLTSSKAFSGFAEVKQGFFFLAVAEGFSADTVLPPNAKLLQLADGGRIVLGEQSENLFLQLALKAKTEEVVTQMQQVIQGMVALASLGKSEDPDVAEVADLVKSIKVTAANNIVNVSVEYPVQKVIRDIGNATKAAKAHQAGDQQRREAADNKESKE